MPSIWLHRHKSATDIKVTIHRKSYSAPKHTLTSVESGKPERGTVEILIYSRRVIVGCNSWAGGIIGSHLGDTNLVSHMIFMDPSYNRNKTYSVNSLKFYCVRFGWIIHLLSFEPLCILNVQILNSRVTA